MLDVRIVPKDESVDVHLENNADIEALLGEYLRGKVFQLLFKA